MKYIDAHCHIDFFTDAEIEGLVNEVDEIYGVAISYESSLKLLKISEKFDNIKISLGIHPEYFEHYHEFSKVKELIIENKEKLYAIGEVGLPFFSLLDKSESEKRRLYNEGLFLLEEFIILAKQLDLPLVLHATQTTARDALVLLKKYEMKRVLFHWLNCDIQTAKEIFSLGYFASASLDIIYNKEYFEFVKCIPIKNLLIESDSPWKYDDTNSRPNDIKKISKILSPVFELEESLFLEQLYKNLDFFLK